MKKLVSSNDAKAFINHVQLILSEMETATVTEKIKGFRDCFFHHFRLSDRVPSSLVPVFVRFAEKFYDKRGLGYDGIMKEISDRVSLYADIDGYVEIREFLKHGDGKTDFYDKDNRVSYEKKTGVGDWLRSERFDTFEEVVKEYRRKRTILVWDYDFVPTSEDMTGKKSVNKNLSEEEKAVLQERTKTKKNGEKVTNKQYEIHIHMEVSYKDFFDYLATYPAGINTFFKESARSGIAGVFVWELQTLKNSKKKIDFLQNCPFNKTKPETEEE